MSNAELFRPNSYNLYCHDLEIDGTLTLPNDHLVIGSLNLLSTINCTSTTAGALLVSGGVGIAKNLYIGGEFLLKDSQITTISDDVGLIEDSPHILSTQQAVKAYVDNKIAISMSWQLPVISFFDPSDGLPDAPPVGSRYISSETANGWVTAHIYTYVGTLETLWEDVTPIEGWACYVLDEEGCFLFNGTTWVYFGVTIDHKKLINIGINTHAQIDDKLVNITSIPAIDRFDAIGVGEFGDGTRICCNVSSNPLYHKNNIYQYNGTSLEWVEKTIAFAGLIFYNKDDTYVYYFDGTGYNFLQPTGSIYDLPAPINIKFDDTHYATIDVDEDNTISIAGNLNNDTGMPNINLKGKIAIYNFTDASKNVTISTDTVGVTTISPTTQLIIDKETHITAGSAQLKTPINIKYDDTHYAIIDVDEDNTIEIGGNLNNGTGAPNINLKGKVALYNFSDASKNVAISTDAVGVTTISPTTGLIIDKETHFTAGSTQIKTPMSILYDDSHSVSFTADNADRLSILSKSGNVSLYNQTNGAHVDLGVNIDGELSISAVETNISGIVTIANSTDNGKSLFIDPDISGTVYLTPSLNISMGKPLICADNTESSTTTSGGLVVAGGVGIAKGLRVGGSISSSSVSSGDIFSSGRIYVDVGGGSAMWTGIKRDTNGDLNYNLALSGLSHLWTRATGTTTFVNQMKISPTAVNIYHGTGSSSTSTGALQVAGGIGISENLQVGGPITTYQGLVVNYYISQNAVTYGNTFSASYSQFKGTTDSSSVTTGAIQVSGGVGIAKNLFVGGIQTITNTTATSGISTGSLVVAGGVGISGGVNIGGTLTKGAGSFLIPHPDPAKDGWKLKHCFVESNTRGDNIYRFTVDVPNDDIDIDLPNYFYHLNENEQCFVTPVDSFGSGYGTFNHNILSPKVKITVNQSGKYNVLVIGTRKDELAKQFFDTYGAEIPPNN